VRQLGVPMVDLSVVVPCRNVASTLAAQLEALTTQEWDREWEVLVVDNGSTDETIDVAQRYATSRVPLRIHEATAGTGVAYARNEGVRAARASCIAICDGDDVVEPGWVAGMGEALRVHELVTGPVDIAVLNRPGLAASRGLSSAGGLPRWAGTPFARGNNCGMQRSVFDRLDGYDESFVGLEDIELSLRAAAMGVTVHFVPTARIQYRYREDVNGIWRQGRFYGASVPALAVCARRLGLPSPPRLNGLKSWAWLFVHAGKLTDADGRLAWLWVLANRIGALEGSLRARSLYV
jgi:glycosyltransferase involved in cell wall biosynthesis